MSEIFYPKPDQLLPEGWQFGIIVNDPTEGTYSRVVPGHGWFCDLLLGCEIDLGQDVSSAITPWSRFLINVMADLLAVGTKDLSAIDLGAGPYCVVSRALQELFPDVKFIAVEPNIPPNAPVNIEAFADLDEVPDKSAHYIMFNPPSSPTKWIDRSLPNWFIFDGGTDGYNVISEVLSQALPKLTDGGSIVVLQPSYFPPICPEGARLEVIETRRTKIDDLIERAPYLNKERLSDELWDMVKDHRFKWFNHGVPIFPDCYYLSATRISRL